MSILFPPIQPNFSRYLSLGQGQQLYYEEVGNPEGVPVLVLHGGPGSGCSSASRQFFDPEFYRIILFDQRGAGRSQPYAGLTDNHLVALIADIEHLRETLHVKRFLLFAGSWGTTLALCYGKQFPGRVSGMILRGIFLARPQDIDWLYGGRTAALHPQAWHAFSGRALGKQGQALLEHYDHELNGDNDILANAAAKAWVNYEYRLSALELPLTASLPKEEQNSTLSMARISARYMLHGCYLDEPVLDNLHNLEGIPLRIIHGRYDLVCPIDQALALKQTCPWADIEIIPLAGHSAYDHQQCKALIRASQQFKEYLA